MRNRKKLPIGIDSFEKIIRHNFYYVDKTEMITELLHNWGEVNLFTRPRRFGKSLNMNMLQSFLEIGCDKSLFNGLKASRKYCKKQARICLQNISKHVSDQRYHLVIISILERFI